MVKENRSLPGTTSSRTRLLGVIGWPISHSLSPLIHSAAIAALDLDAVYLAFPVHPSKLSVAIFGLEAAGAMGLNVTAPHKEEVVPLLQGLTDLAAGLGAVNTIFRDEGGALIGDNTDVRGIEGALRETRPDLQGASAAVVGAGGAAAAAVAALVRRGAGRVTILGRSLDRAEILASRIAGGAMGGGASIRAVPMVDHEKILKDCAVLIQASSAPIDPGPPVDPALCPQGALVVELAYDPIRPRSTAFLEAARRSGLTTVNGEEILARQASLSWERWTGRPVEAVCLQAMTEISRTYQGIGGPP